jgi:superfamily II DNA or RNA helicase
MGSELVSREPGRTLWITHRNELVEQSADALRAIGLDVGIVSAKRTENDQARVLVASWQTLVARSGTRPPADLLVIDECHHVGAEEWTGVVSDYAAARKLGLTATPQRRDGKPLGDVFQALVVAAQYSELIRAGHLVGCRLIRPPQAMGSDLANDPLETYIKRAAGKSCIAFCRSIEESEKLAERFTEAGHPAKCISANTPAALRAHTIDAFRAGDLTALTCVFTLTEGFDHPPTEVCLLARGCSHVGTYLQMVGRVLRPAPGKQDAVVIDLSGISWIHGTPTEDRQYSLDGKPISSSGALKVCGSCGFTWDPDDYPRAEGCPKCGFVPEPMPVIKPRIWDIELEEVYAGADTPDSAKNREFQRLRRLCKEKNWGLSFAIKEYKKLFTDPPPLSDITEDEWREEYHKLVAFARSRNYKEGFALVRFKEMAGRWPPRNWRA